MIEVKRDDGRIEIVKYPEKKVVTETGVTQHYRTVVVDTINAAQNSLFRKTNRDKSTTLNEWRDFGWEILDLFDKIKKLDDTLLILILGMEGTGKTVGGKYLDPDTTLWDNADNKPLSFFGARSMYPPDNSKKNYSGADDYDSILTVIKAAHSKRKGTLIVFVLGHVEMYKGSGDLIYERLKVLGKQATKLGIESLNAFATYYTKVQQGLAATDVNRYKLTTATTGFNTARTPEGYHAEAEIPNNLQAIVDKVLEDFGELKPL